MIAKRFVLLLATLLPFGTGGALAHATLEASEPAAETTVARPLEEVRLVFTEAVELAFSRFEIHELDAAGVDRTADDAWQRLGGLAGALVSAALDGRGDAGAARIDAGLANAEGRSDEVVLELRDDLAPGVYVVVWRVLSVDTHATQGFFVFEYAPRERP